MANSLTIELLRSVVALVAVTVLGYVLRRLQLLSTPALSGIHYAAIVLGLPAVMVGSVSSISLGDIDWVFVASWLTANVMLRLTVGLVSYWFFEPSVGLSANRAMLSTSGATLGFAQPILAALYPPVLAQYLFVFVFIDSSVILPCMIFLYELQAARNAAAAQGSAPPPAPPATGTDTADLDTDPDLDMEAQSSPKSVGAVAVMALRRTVSSPIVLGGIVGLILNFASHGNPPLVITNTLNIVSNLFLGSVLVMLGAAIYDNTAGTKFGGRRLVGPVLLTTAKLIVFPVLAKAMAVAFSADSQRVDGTDYDTGTLSFIYSSVPTAPEVQAFAALYATNEAEAAATIVVSTLLGAPFVFTTGVLAASSSTIGRSNGTSSAYFSTNYQSLVYDTSQGLTIVSILGVAFTLLVLGITSNIRFQLHKVSALVISIPILVFCIAVQTCRDAGHHSLAANNARFVLIWTAILAMRVTIINNSISILRRNMLGIAAAQQWQRRLQVVGTIVVVVFVIILSTTGLPNAGYSPEQCWFSIVDLPGGRTSYLVLNLITVVIGAVALAWTLLRGAEQSRDAGMGGSSVPVPAGRSSAPAPAIRSSGASASEPGLEEPLLQSAGDTDGHGRHIVSVGANSENSDVDDDNSGFWRARDLGFCLLQLLSMIFSATTTIWMLSTTNRHGLFEQLSFLDVLFLGLQGAFLCIFFGTEHAGEAYRTVAEWAMRQPWIRRLVFGGGGRSARRRLMRRQLHMHIGEGEAAGGLASRADGGERAWFPLLS